MRTTVKGKNLEIRDDDRQYVEHKMRRLERLLDDRSDALVELSMEPHRDIEDSHIVEVTLLIDGRLFRGVSRARSYRAAVDDVVDKLERQSVEYKERRRGAGSPGGNRASARQRPDEAPEREPEGGRRVVKVKRFAIEPMFEEDAVGRMEELGHSFFVFVNAETEQLAVLYRRRDGHFGLIEPVVGGAYTAGANHRGR